MNDYLYSPSQSPIDAKRLFALDVTVIIVSIIYKRLIKIAEIDLTLVV